MPSPFPGMDPYLESQGFWQDFHFRLIALPSEALTPVLPGELCRLDRGADQPRRSFW